MCPAAITIPMTAKREGPTALARFGLVAVVLTAAAITMLQAVDGVALKWAVDAWADAPADQEGSTFAAAMALRWTEYALQSYSNIVCALAGMAGCRLGGRLDHPRPDGFLRWPLRLGATGSCPGSHGGLGVCDGCSDVAQRRP